jgi:cbb3-type cytochrome oxidase subunit 1
MMLKVGSLTQRAHPILSIFVMACCIVTVGLLYVMQKAEATADSLVRSRSYSQFSQE